MTRNRRETVTLGYPRDDDPLSGWRMARRHPTRRVITSERIFSAVHQAFWEGDSVRNVHCCLPSGAPGRALVSETYTNDDRQVSREGDSVRNVH
jgi:hypothetical protein